MCCCCQGLGLDSQQSDGWSGGRAPPVTGPALCLLGVRQRGWTTRQRQQKLDRTPIFFNSVNTLTTMYQYLRRERGQIIGEQNPMLVMFTSYTDQITKENILADLNNPDGLVTVVLCTSALSVGVSVSSVKYTTKDRQQKKNLVRRPESSEGLLWIYLRGLLIRYVEVRSNTHCRIWLFYTFILY